MSGLTQRLRDECGRRPVKMARKLIIGIHGLANKPRRDTLEEWWRKSIAEGLSNIRAANTDFEFKMVYWADLLYRHPLHRDKAFTFDRLYNEEPYLKAKQRALKKYKDTWRDDATRIAGKLFGGAADILREPFGFDALADRVLSKTLRDLHFYYDANRKIFFRTDGPGSGRSDLASRVLRAELREALIEEMGSKIMLIAHSMGSIIAYDVLRDLGRENADVEIEHFVTIGSPLGLPHVKGKILKQRTYDKRVQRVRTPSIVTGSWKNYADRKDPVALDSHLRDDYEANARGVRVVDDLVMNDYKAPGRKPNPHKSYGYLRTPEVSEHIAAFLGSRAKKRAAARKRGSARTP